jgi:hypothetical protein
MRPAGISRKRASVLGVENPVDVGGVFFRHARVVQPDRLRPTLDALDLFDR